MEKEKRESVSEFVTEEMLRDSLERANRLTMVLVQEVHDKGKVWGPAALLSIALFVDQFCEGLAMSRTRDETWKAEVSHVFGEFMAMMYFVQVDIKEPISQMRRIIRAKDFITDKEKQ
jgi:hypothetical protein